MRFRDKFLLGGSFIVMAALLATDPDNGLSTGMLLLNMSKGLLILLVVHWSRKALLDYDSADMSDLFSKAKETPEGAGKALIAVAIIFYALIGLFAGRAL